MRAVLAAVKRALMVAIWAQLLVESLVELLTEPMAAALTDLPVSTHLVFTVSFMTDCTNMGSSFD